MRRATWWGVALGGAVLLLHTWGWARPKMDPSSVEAAVYVLFQGEWDTPGSRDTEETRTGVRRALPGLEAIARGERPYPWLPAEEGAFLWKRASALWWITKVDPQHAVRLARQILERDPEHPSVIFPALGECGTIAEAGPLLVEGLEAVLTRGTAEKTTDNEIKDALRSLMNVHYRPAVPAIEKCLDSSMSSWALEALGEIGGPEAVGVLHTFIVQHSTSLSVGTALRALGKIGGPEHLALIEGYRSHGHTWVREGAEEAVQAIRKRAGLPPPESPKGSLGFQPLKTLPAGATTLLAPATGGGR